MTVGRLRRILAQYDADDRVAMVCSGAHSGHLILEPENATFVPELDLVVIHEGETYKPSRGRR